MTTYIAPGDGRRHWERLEGKTDKDFFATAQFVVMKQEASDLVAVPTSLVHAKEMGTTMTACGQSAVTWVKLWAQSFNTVSGERCRDCWLVVSHLAPNPGASQQ